MPLPSPEKRRTPGGGPGERQKVARQQTSTANRTNWFRAYPGQRRPVWQVLSDLRRRHWAHEPELTASEAAQVWDAFVGDDHPDVALGRLLFELHEYGRVQRPRSDRRTG